MSDKQTKRPALEVILERMEQMERYLAGEKRRHDKSGTSGPFLAFVAWAEFQTLVRVLMEMEIAAAERQNAAKRLRNLDQSYCFGGLGGEDTHSVFRRLIEELQHGT